MKQTIIDRATNYAYMVAGGSPDIVWAGEAYQRGAEDEHRLLTEWHNPKEEVPEINVAVLVKSQYGKLGIGYYMGTNAWDAFGHRLASDVVTAWRPIHEK